MVPNKDGHRAEALEPDVSEAGFRWLAEFRHCIRQFLRFGEEAARSKGIESQQLCLSHQSTVELVNHLVDQGALKRRHADRDEREVLVELTLHGEHCCIGFRCSTGAVAVSLVFPWYWRPRLGRLAIEGCSKAQLGRLFGGGLFLFVIYTSFAYYSPMGSDRHKVILSFAYQHGWRCTFFEGDRKRTILPRTAFFNSEETLTEFVRRSGGIKTLEDRNIFEMQLKRNFGDVNLNLTLEQYRELLKGSSK